MFTQLLRVRLFTARKRSLGQGNVFAPVCHSIHGGGMCCTGVGAGKGGDSVQGGGVLSVIGSGIIIPPSPSRTVPPQVNKRVVGILLGCFLVSDLKPFCHNGGTASESGGSWTCDCTDAFKGTFCEEGTTALPC